MVSREEPMQAERTLVDAVLRGKITPQTDPAVFEDDVLYLKVRSLEQRDAGWLVERLKSPESTESGREELAKVVSAQIRAAAGLPSVSKRYFTKD